MSDQILAVQALEEALDLLEQDNARLRNNNRVLRVVNSALRGQLEIAHRNDEEFKRACEEDSPDQVIPPDLFQGHGMNAPSIVTQTGYVPNSATWTGRFATSGFITPLVIDAPTSIPSPEGFQRLIIDAAPVKEGYAWAGTATQTTDRYGKGRFAFGAPESDATGFIDKSASDSIEYKKFDDGPSNSCISGYKNHVELSPNGYPYTVADPCGFGPPPCQFDVYERNGIAPIIV